MHHDDTGSVITSQIGCYAKFGSVCHLVVLATLFHLTPDFNSLLNAGCAEADG